MLVFVLLLLGLLPHMVCIARLGKCNIRGPHLPLHKYHQSGDLVIGGIASLTFVMVKPVDFTEEPPQTLSEDLL